MIFGDKATTNPNLSLFSKKKQTHFFTIFLYKIIKKIYSVFRSVQIIIIKKYFNIKLKKGYSPLNHKHIFSQLKDTNQIVYKKTL